MKVLSNTKYHGLVLGDALDLVTPFPGDFDGCLYGFSSCIHGQHHIEVEIFCDKFCKAWEDIVVECSRAER